MTRPPRRLPGFSITSSPISFISFISRDSVPGCSSALALGIPCFYTPTDFWTGCPTIQLLLENNQTCAGPSKKGGNCALHMGMRSHNPVIARLSRMVPAAVADTIINVATRVPAFTGALGRDLAATGRRLRVNVSRLNRLNGIFSPTQFMTEILAVNGVNRRLIIESAYGLDTLARETPAVRSQCRRPFVFGFIGTLAPHKGCHLLIDAFRIFPTGYARLEIYGDPARFPEYHATLQQLASQAVGIEFRGTFPHTGLAGVLASIDALVVPSLWYENAPLIVSSALAARCPVIASDSPGLVALVRHNVNGLVFSPGDAIALRDAMLEITRSPDLYTNLSAGCEPQRSTSQYVEQLLAHYVSHCQLLNGVNGPAQTDTNKELHPQAQP